MTEFKVISGGWTRSTETSMKGTVDASLTARAIAGSEMDESYEFYATVKITTGKVAVLCNFTYDVNWNERYVEMVLDPTGDTIMLEAVTRDDTGAETSRVTLASRNMPLVTGTTYNLRLVSKKLSDGNYAVCGYIDDFLLVEAEDLADPYQKGMHGLESLGAADQYTEYSQIIKTKTPLYSSLKAVKDILQITEDTWNAEIISCIVSTDADIDGALDKENLFIPSDIPQNIKDASAHYAAWLFRKRRDPTGAQVFKDEADHFLAQYIEAKGEVPFKVGQA